MTASFISPKARRTQTKLFTGLGLWLLCQLIVWPTSVHAHAVLLQTDPPAGARLDAAPDQVTLVFNERVESVFNSVRVLDLHGQRRDSEQVRVEDGDTLVISLQPLVNGPYGVFWRVNSLDGHQVQGQFGFGVGTAAPTDAELAEAVPAQADVVPQWYFQVFKGISLTGLALWLGGISFLALIIRPVVRAASSPDEQTYLARVFGRSAPVMMIGGILFLLSEVATLWGKTAVFAQIPFRQALSIAAVQGMLSTTSLGQWWIIRSVTALALLILTSLWLAQGVGGLLSKGKGNSAWMASLTILGGCLLATIASTGHAGAVTNGALVAEISDWIHLAATAVWVGGLLCLLSALSLSRTFGLAAMPSVNRMTPRFSRMAQVCVLALIVTGIYNTWLHIPSWDAFLSSGYGRVLTAKIALVIGTLLVAAINWKWALPAMASYAQAKERAVRWSARLHSLVQAEVLLVALILATVAILTSLPPAATVSAGGPAEMQQKSGEYLVDLRLAPDKVGSNQAQVQIHNSAHQVISNARRVTVYTQSLDMDMGLQTVEASPSPDGGYRADVPLSMAGKWLITVEVSPPKGDTFTTEFKVTSTL